MSADVAEPLLRLVDISKKYELPAETVEVLDEVSLDVEPGTLVCIYGESGSGKSTLLNLAATVGQPDSGTVWFESDCVSSLPTEGRAQFRLNQVGIVFQDGNLIPDFTANENIEVLLRARGFERSTSSEETAKALEALGIGELGRRYPKELSGGQQQRVGIARAIAGGKRLVIADEPTGALDRKNSQKLFELFAELVADLDVAVLMGTHDQGAEQFSSHSFRLIDGKLVDYASSQ